jgi:purine-binding chemotaxis protein CheW
MSESKPLLDQQDALQQYLQDMLHEAAFTETQAETVAPDKVIFRDEAVVPNHPATPFQALLFELHGMSLALPLDQLDGIEKWPTSALPKIADKPAHYLGLLSRPGLHTQVIDPGNVLQTDPDKTLPPRYILLVDDKRWGLAVSSVKKVLTIDGDDCKWRQAGQRPWFAGTVLSGLTHILDLSALLKAL